MRVRREFVVVLEALLEGRDQVQARKNRWGEEEEAEETPTPETPVPPPTDAVVLPRQLLLALHRPPQSAEEGENVKEITGLEDNLEKQVSSLLDKGENTRTVDLSEVVEESKNEDDEDVKLNKMTITELREYAVLKNIAIDPKIKKKSEIVELLESTVESTI